MLWIYEDVCSRCGALAPLDRWEICEACADGCHDDGRVLLRWMEGDVECVKWIEKAALGDLLKPATVQP